MATVKKLKFTRYVIADPLDAKKVVYVNAKTPGAKKVTVEGGHLFRRLEGGRADATGGNGVGAKGRSTAVSG